MRTAFLAQAQTKGAVMTQNDQEWGEGGLRPDPRSLVLSALQAEFGWMRDEIGRHMDHEKELHQMSIVTLAAMFTLIGVLLNAGNKSAIAYVLLLVPFTSFIFALTAQNLSRQVLQVAAHLNEITRIANQVLQPTFQQIFTKEQLESDIVWTWEQWKDYNFQQATRRGRRFFIMLEKSRWLSMILPGLVSLIIFLAMHKSFANVAWYWFGASALILVLSLVIVFIYTEAPGVRDCGQGFKPFSLRVDTDGRSRDALIQRYIEQMANPEPRPGL